MTKKKKESSSSFIPVALLTLFVGIASIFIAAELNDKDIMFVTFNKACTWKEYKEIRSVGYKELASRATVECGEKLNVKLIPTSLKQNYALIFVKPDGVNCNTSPAWMVLVKENGKWEFVVLGTDPKLLAFFAEKKDTMF